MLAIVAAYLTFVGVGTFVMKRLPGDGFRFYGLSFVYNIVQVMLCSYMCIESLVIALRQGYSITPCNTFDVSRAAGGEARARARAFARATGPRGAHARRSESRAALSRARAATNRSSARRSPRCCGCSTCRRCSTSWTPSSS